MGAEGEGGKTDWDDEAKAAFSTAVIQRFDTEMTKPEESRAALYFAGIVVPGRLDLHGKKIPDVSFRCAVFSHFAVFSDAQFSAYADFREVEFAADAIFSGAKFSAYADFRKARFFSPVVFSDAQFFGPVVFSEAQFAGSVDFSEAQFSGGAYFSNAQFSGDAIFSGGQIPGSGNIRSFKWLSFASAVFAGAVDFSDRQFQGRTDFRVREFKRAPRFHGSVLHQDTAFPRIECFHERDTEDAARAYQTLRLAMENHRARQAEGMFFALEQESRRRSGEFTGIAKWISLAYEKGSSYGLSIMRPLWAFFCIFFVSATIVMHITAYSGVRSLGADGPEIAGDAIVFSFRQSVIPFDAFRQRPEELKKWKLFPEPQGLFQILAAIQSVLSALCILLLVLAVRWRYRR